MSTGKGKGRQLAPDQRAVLARLLADRPGDSAGQVALDFAARTGGVVSPQAVSYLRRNGGYRDRPANGHLTPAEREALTLLILEDDREYQPAAAVAARFAALTGRTIDGNTVRNLRVRLGLPPSGKGPGPRTSPRKEAS